MTLNEELILAYVQNAYPLWIRQGAYDVWSLTYNYDFVRVFTFAAYKDALELGVKNLSVQTASSDWLTLWEEFLKIAVNDSLSDNVRRATILTKLVGSNSTIGNIKSILTAYTWNSLAFKITEKWTYSVDVNDVWTYIVSIYDKPIWYSETELRWLIEKIQPAHCLLEIESVPDIMDAIGVHDSFSGSFKHLVWDWDVALWWDENNPLSGFLWS